MTECPDECRLLFAPYMPPSVRKGDRAFCLFRDADVNVTSWSVGRLSWPRCQKPRQRGGSGLLVTDELRRAIESESSAALVYWFGVNQQTVWRWRLAFSVGQWDTPGSKRLHRKTCDSAAAMTRGQRLPETTREKMRQAAARPEHQQRLAAGRAKRWTRTNRDAVLGVAIPNTGALPNDAAERQSND